MQLYADIVLPLAQPVYTFAVPGGTDVAAGQAVAVQFGARKFYTGIVWRVHDRRPDFKTVKPIQRVLYDAPLLSAQQMSLWEWIASYYMCSLGEVMRVALPALMKPSGDTEEEFSGDEFRPRTECYVSLAAELRDEGRFHEVCEKIERRAPKQYEALLELAAAGDETRIATGEVARRLLRADYAVLHALERKKYIVCTQRERSVERGESAFRLPELTAHQLTALNALREQFAAGKTTALLQGVTGSGKTEIYIHLIAEVLSRGGQVMLFQNRRGFSPYVACSECGWTARCPHCNVTLTYHKGGRKLVCHYCGHTEDVPAKCPSCKVTDVLPMGFGTEKVEEEISRIFPEARVARLDRDSVTSEKAFSAIIADFEARRTDILVGTQMITKGFDFAGVSLVGILNADNLLNNPDFRAAERAFQLMMQVAGRAGRRDDGGEVVIQTSEPGHPVIRQVAAGDFEGMARAQLAERKAFFYPPYARLTSLTLRHRDPSVLRNGVMDLAARLRTRFGRRLLGPMTPPVDRIRGEYLVGLLLKIESGASSARARELLAAELKTFAGNPAFKSITVIVNVDPQ